MAQEKVRLLAMLSVAEPRPNANKEASQVLQGIYFARRQICAGGLPHESHS